VWSQYPTSLQNDISYLENQLILHHCNLHINTILTNYIATHKFPLCITVKTTYFYTMNISAIINKNPRQSLSNITIHRPLLQDEHSQLLIYNQSVIQNPAYRETKHQTTFNTSKMITIYFFDLLSQLLFARRSCHANSYTDR